MGTLSQNITQAIADFDSIYQAIADKGINFPITTPTSQYANKIALIEGGGTSPATIVFDSAIMIANLNNSLYNQKNNEYILNPIGTGIVYGAGKFNNCYSATNYSGLKLSDNLLAELSNNFSVSCWFKINDTGLTEYPLFRRILTFADSGNYYGVEIGSAEGLSTNKITLIGSNVGGVNVTSSIAYNDGLFHLLVLRKVNKTLTVTIDNNIQLSTFGAGLTNVLSLVEISHEAFSLNGYIDQFCGWDYAISDMDIDYLWNQ